jgi:3-hydroxy-9,10-secoandrosta-1,3,5(10)-triene-9,17-dione monooxygenase reductase component
VVAVAGDEQARTVLRYENPFVAPPEARDPARRLRGRLPAPVTVWTSWGGGGPVGLTVSSILVAEGEPAHVLGLIGPLSDLWEGVEGAGTFVVHVLGHGDRALADRFSGARPGLGGPFGGLMPASTAYGPLLPGAFDWAGCRLAGSSEAGYHLLVRGTIEEVHLDAKPGAEPLIYLGGRYRRLARER